MSINHIICAIFSLLLLLLVANITQIQAKPQDDDHFQFVQRLAARNNNSSGIFAANQELTKRPASFIVLILREFFTDIDWETIERAREQVEVFIRRFDKLLNLFWPIESSSTTISSKNQTPAPTFFSSIATKYNHRLELPTSHKLLESNPNGVNPSGLLDQFATTLTGGDSSPASTVAGNIAGNFAWGAQTTTTIAPSTTPQPKQASAAGANLEKLASGDNSIREMLNRIACFAGYMRLLNESHQMLAELDAAKVLSNLFGVDSAGKKKSSSWLSSLFG